MAGSQIVNDVIINYKSVGLDKVGSEIKQASVALDGLVVSATGSEKAIGSIENRFKSLERTLGTTGGNAQKFAKDQETINKAVAQNPALQDRANEALAASAAKYGIATKATEAHTNSSKLARYELINLSRQLQDVGVSLFSGQSPLTVAVQQGSQIADVFASSQATVGGAFRQMGSAALAFITPVNAGIAAVVGLTAAAAALAVQYDKVNVASQRAISGAGARTGTTVSDLNSFVDKNTPSVTSGASLSQKESRALAEGLTQTGDIVISKLQSMSAAVVGFSNQTGKSMDESVKAFIAMGKEPVKALDELAKAFGPFSQQTRDLVEDANVAGDKTAAWNVILKSLGATAEEAAGRMTAVEKAGRGIVNFLGTSQQATGLEKQLAAVTSQLNAAIESANKWAQVGVAAPPEVSNSIAALSKKFEELYARQQAVINQRVASQFNDVADKARVVTEALIPQIQQIKDMEAALNKLKAAQAQGGGGADLSAAITQQQNVLQLTKQSKEEAARYNQQVAMIAQAWGNVGQSVALQLQIMQNSLPVARAWTEATRMRAQEQATYNNLVDKGKTSEEAAAVAAKEYELSKASAVASAEKLVQSSQDNLDKIRAQGTGMEAVVDYSITYRDAIQAGATATQAASIAGNNLAASMLQAAKAAQQMEQSVLDAANGTKNGILTPESAMALGAGGSQFTPSVMPVGPLTFQPNPWVPVSYKGGGGRDITPYDPNAFGSGFKQAPGFEKFYANKDPAVNDLKKSIDNLANSTDGLNSTMGDLLSPYYTQDPRTSHIGFRSQGMASGGYVDVPGAPSANDNMMAMIPVASGERIYVDPMPSKRGVGGGTIIHISAPMTFTGPANRDEVGRTVYQNLQSATRGLAAAQR